MVPLLKCQARPYRRECSAGLGFTRMLFIAKEKTKREQLAAAARTMLGDRSFEALAPEDIVPVLDALTLPTTTESSVRGYIVRVSRQRLTPEDVVAKRKAVAQVIARSIRPG